MEEPHICQPKTRVWLIVVVLGVGCLVLAVHAWRYMPFFSDDALISLRYAERLTEGHGLTWNDGERVEGYSNLLWLLLCAGLGSLGIDLITAARILGFLGMAAVFGAILYAFRPTRLANAPPGLIAILLVALSGPTAVWAIGGLEQPLLAGLLAWSVAILVRRFEHPDRPLGQLLAAGTVLGLIAVTRADGLLLCGLLCASYSLACGISFGAVKQTAVLAVPALLFSAAQLIFRLSYYGEWAPNTALVKVALTRHHADLGLLYLSRGLTAFLPLLILSGAAALTTLWHARSRRKLVLLIVPVVLWPAYLVVVGGDIFPAHRRLLVLVVLLGFVVAQGLTWLEQRSCPGSQES